MRNSLPVYFFLFFFAFYTAAQTSAQSPAQSRSDTARIAHLLRLGYYDLNRPWPDKSYPDSALLFFNQALQLSVTLREPEGKNKAWAAIGAAYMKSGDLSRAKASFFHIVEYY